MSLRFLVLLAVVAGFAVLSALALADVGYFGIIAPHFKSWGGAQVFTDLVIAVVLACAWMIADGRSSGVNPWPFVALAVVAGSFGPLLYLAVRELKPAVGTAPSR